MNVFGLLAKRRWRGLQRRREALAAGSSSDLVRQWLQSPLPDADLPIENARLLALDLELTGLDPKRDSILSIGWIPIEAGRIRVVEASHRLVAHETGVGQSASIHGILDHEARSGEPLDEVLSELAAALTGRIPIVHHAPLDTAFLERAYAACHGAGFPRPVIDTLALEQNRRHRRNQSIGQGELRLIALREQYGLPPAAAHNALGDALATAELLLAMTSGRGLTLSDLAA